MDSCLPGMASRVNRAATSEMRVAPLVITTNWITIMMVKITNPTRALEPATNSPKACTTSPAAPTPSSPARRGSAGWWRC